VSHRLLSRVALWSKFSQGLNAATSSCTYSRRPVEEDRNPASYLPRGEFGGGTTRKGGNKLPPNFLPKTARRVRACSLHRCGSRPPHVARLTCTIGDIDPQIAELGFGSPRVESGALEVSAAEPAFTPVAIWRIASRAR